MNDENLRFQILLRNMRKKTNEKIALREAGIIIEQREQSSETDVSSSPHSNNGRE